MARAVEECKDSDAFMSNAIMATVCIYVASFDNYKVKVTKAYVGIDLHHITSASKMEEEEEDDLAKEGLAIEERTMEERGANRGIDEVVAAEA